MTKFARLLLATIARLEAEFADSVPPPAVFAKGQDLRCTARKRRAAAGWQYQKRKHLGPRVSDILGALGTDSHDETVRKRVARTLARLESDGLVDRSGTGMHLNHVMLTDAGRKALQP